MPVKGHEKNAWMLLAFIGFIGIIFSLLLIAQIRFDPSLLENQLGRSVSSFQASNPNAWGALLYSERDAGAALLGFSILGIFIAWTAFKDGKKWAWYAELYLPIYILFVIAETYYAGGSNWPLYFVFLLISLAALLLPYRKFFPKM